METFARKGPITDIAFGVLGFLWLTSFNVSFGVLLQKLLSYVHCQPVNKVCL